MWKMRGTQQTRRLPLQEKCFSCTYLLPPNLFVGIDFQYCHAKIGLNMVNKIKYILSLIEVHLTATFTNAFAVRFYKIIVENFVFSGIKSSLVLIQAISCLYIPSYICSVAVVGCGVTQANIQTFTFIIVNQYP